MIQEYSKEQLSNYAEGSDTAKDKPIFHVEPEPVHQPPSVRTINITFLKIIKFLLSLASIFLPLLIYLSPNKANLFWDLALISVFILMSIRPLAQLIPSWKLSRFISLRKQLGIFSATIIVSFAFVHYTASSFSWSTYFSFAYWSFTGGLFWAHLGELTGFLLLITSNRFSMRLLKRNWKRLQRLSYVYFFSGSWYVFTIFHKPLALIGIIIIFELTLLSFIKKRLISRGLW